ncbi:MAG: hypothetical protein IPO07_12735 [Haliscomenobacter sp.]|nr:hypothetical protein [Haliscomenobacter sp.]MBK9489548.1 hypothetical protein [Haliscomenobacter sp.]
MNTKSILTGCACIIFALGFAPDSFAQKFRRRPGWQGPLAQPNPYCHPINKAIPTMAATGFIISGPAEEPVCDSNDVARRVGVKYGKGGCISWGTLGANPAYRCVGFQC